MKAIVLTQYGPPEVLQTGEVPRPVPRRNEVLIRVRATSVNYGDLMARNFRAVTTREFNMPAPLLLISRMYFGTRKPRITILGSEFSGTIESAGKDVKSFRPGDEVFGYLAQRMGAYAEYFCMPENGVLAMKPANMTFEEAAVVPYGAIMALPLLKKADIRPGHKVLINGASGGIGSAAVQIAKHLGAEVTGVCGTPRLQFVRTLGADRVVDYTKEDFTRNGETYDLILDVLGRSTFARCKGSLKEKGIYLRASFKMRELFQMLWTSVTGGRRVICTLAPGSREDLLSVKKLMEEGRIKAIIDKSFPMEQAAAAHRYAGEGHKRGNVVIAMGPAGQS